MGTNEVRELFFCVAVVIDEQYVVHLSPNQNCKEDFWREIRRKKR